MLNNYFYLILKRKRLNDKMIFQQDGVPSHFSKDICTWFYEKFSGRWIGGGSPISWAARSADLTPLDIFLGGGGVH